MLDAYVLLLHFWNSLSLLLNKFVLVAAKKNVEGKYPSFLVASMGSNAHLVCWLKNESNMLHVKAFAYHLHGPVIFMVIWELYYYFI